MIELTIILLIIFYLVFYLLRPFSKKELKRFSKKEKFNKFIENAALKSESVNIEFMLKHHKENLKKGTMENYQLFDR